MNKIIFSKFHIRTIGAIVALAVIISSGGVTYASHSWGNFHWARTSNPFTLKLGDNVSSTWDPYFVTASNDWNVSTVLDTTIVAGKAKGNCRPTVGRVEVCNNTYGSNGMLGWAQVWAKDNHITQAVAIVNDTYFNTDFYNTTAFRNMVMCQEIGHAFGLHHQDEEPANINLGTCMDYTNDPTGTADTNGVLNNEFPNAHDYAQLETIYGHLDSTKTVSMRLLGRGTYAPFAVDIAERNMSLRRDSRGRTTLYERDLGQGNKLLTFIIWAN